MKYRKKRSKRTKALRHRGTRKTLSIEKGIEKRLDSLSDAELFGKAVVMYSFLCDGYDNFGYEDTE